MEQEKTYLDLQPTLVYLAFFSTGTISLLHLQKKKTAFLLAVTGFLHPSDLERIDKRQSQVITESGKLRLVIKSSKETRKGRRIIKTVYISSFSDPEPCPVKAFLRLKNYPA